MDCQRCWAQSRTPVICLSSHPFLTSPLLCSLLQRLTPTGYVILAAPLPIVHCWALPVGALGPWGRVKEGRSWEAAPLLLFPSVSLSQVMRGADSSSSITSSPPSALGPSLCLTSGLPDGGLFGPSTPPRPRFPVSTQSSLS